MKPKIQTGFMFDFYGIKYGTRQDKIPNIGTYLLLFRNKTFILMSIKNRILIW